MRSADDLNEFVQVVRELHLSTGRGWEDLCVLFGARLRVGDRELIRKVVLNVEHAALPSLRRRDRTEGQA